MKKPKKSLADLRSNATIWCLYCEETKPQTGAQKFRAHHVCADCTQKLQTGTGPGSKS